MSIDEAPTGGNVPAPRARRGVTLAEPVTVSQFWKNRRHDAIVARLGTHHGRNLVDIRQYCMANGRLVPTPRGVSLSVRRLPELHKAVTKALRQARELGLLPPDDAG
jgi:hypothetical protein